MNFQLSYDDVMDIQIKEMEITALSDILKNIAESNQGVPLYKKQGYKELKSRFQKANEELHQTQKKMINKILQDHNIDPTRNRQWYIDYTNCILFLETEEKE